MVLLSVRKLRYYKHLQHETSLQCSARPMFVDTYHQKICSWIAKVSSRCGYPNRNQRSWVRTTLLRSHITPAPAIRPNSTARLSSLCSETTKRSTRATLKFLFPLYDAPTKTTCIGLQMLLRSSLSSVFHSLLFPFTPHSQPGQPLTGKQKTTFFAE